MRAFLRWFRSLWRRPRHIPQPERVVSVSSSDELRDAIDNAKPGDEIAIKRGTYLTPEQAEERFAQFLKDIDQ